MPQAVGVAILGEIGLATLAATEIALGLTVGAAVGYVAITSAERPACVVLTQDRQS